METLYSFWMRLAKKPFFGHEKTWLVAFNVSLGSILVWAHFQGFLPLDLTSFLFAAFLVFLFTLYRPGAAFLFLIGLIPFETIRLAPQVIPFDLRPYQLVALLLFAALCVRFLAGKLTPSFIRFAFPDALLGLVGIGAFLALFGAPDVPTAAKQACVLLSFGLLYFLMRQFLRHEENLRHIQPFLAGSAAVVFGTALWQAWRMRQGLEAFTAMTERPNATFPEADWLGLYAGFMVLLLAVQLSSALPALRRRLSAAPWAIAYPFFLLVLLVAGFATLIVAVSRSAWLATAAGFLVFFALVVWEYIRGYLSAKRTIAFFLVPLLACLLALAGVRLFSLTAFDLSERSASSASGLQTITISCSDDRILPERIESLEELAPLGCRHINLEEREAEAAAGRSVTQVLRPDPNVSLRRHIYAESLHLIREHPILGIGWGNARLFLGNDGNGTGLNASNIFLEVWLGSGFLGFFGFLLFWFWLLVIHAGAFLRREPGAATSRLFIALFFLVTVFNLFNSGLLLALTVFFFALSLFQEGRPLFTPKTPSL
ncbi:MAG: O-antigen ligase family protein [Candidatus Moraniibacteriota bacterium]